MYWQVYSKPAIKVSTAKVTSVLQLLHLSTNTTIQCLVSPQGVHKALECELEAGQMLYLPCGWFHEVRSYGSSQEGGHLALNYWFHPPDQADPKAGSILEPYRQVCLAVLLRYGPKYPDCSLSAVRTFVAWHEGLSA